MRQLIYVVIVVLVGSAAIADTKDMKKSMGMGSAMLIPAATEKFVDVPEMKGVKMAQIEGDPTKGAAHFMIKFDKGFAAPAHHHTADHFVTVVTGTIVLNVDGKDTKLGPGSYFSFAGMKPHSTRCEGATGCTISVDARGAWDVVPEATAMTSPNGPTAGPTSRSNPSTPSSAQP